MRAEDVTTERRCFRLALAGAAVILLALGYPVVTGEVYLTMDLKHLHLPIRVFFDRALAEGHDFDWFPYQFSGYYLHGEGQGALYHPFNLLLYAALPLAVAFNLEIVRGYLLLLPGTYLFLRRWHARRDGAMVGALIFAFSSFNFLRFMQPNLIGITSQLPWMLLAVDVVVRERDPQKVCLGAVGVVLLTASQLLFGHPPTVWLVLLAAASYFVLLHLPLRHALTPSGRRRVASTAGILGVALGLGVLAGMIQLVPQLEAMRDSHRASPAPGFTSTHALHPANLVQPVAPYLFRKRVIGLHTPGSAFYCGAAAPVLVAWLLLRGRRVGPAWRLGAGMLVVSGVALLLSLGEPGLLYRLQAYLPLVRLFRAPERYLLLVQLGVAVASAVAFCDLARTAEGRDHPGERGERRVWPFLLALPALALVLAAIGLWIRSGETGVPSAIVASPLRVLAGPALVGAATAAVLAAARGRRGALAFLVVLVAADLGTYGLSWIWKEPPRTLQSIRERWDLPGWIGEHRVPLGAPLLTIEGVRFPFGYAGLPPRRALHPYSEPWLRVASVAKGGDPPTNDPLPRARLVTRATATDDMRAEIERTDVDTTALVEEPLDLPGGVPGRARIVREVPGTIDVETRAPTRQLLVLSESHHEGWRATVDGRPCPILRVYADYMGCVVDPGDHLVRFRFEPESLVIGARLSLLGLALTILWAGAWWTRARSRTTPAPA